MGGYQLLEESARGRLEVWKAASQMIISHPFGIGLNRFKEEIGSYIENVKLDAHNAYVLVCAEAGIAGGLLLIGTMVGLLGTGIGFARVASDPEHRSLAYGYLVSTGCIVLGNVYGSPLFSGEVMGNFWGMSGLVAAQYRTIAATASMAPRRRRLRGSEGESSPRRIASPLRSTVTTSDDEP